MKVLITREIPNAGLDILKQHPEIELDYRRGSPLTKEELIQAIRDVDGIIPVIPDKIDEDVLKNAKNLKIVAHYAVGYDNIDTAAATKLGIYVSNTPGNLTEAVAEHSLALMMAVGRRIVESDKYTRQGEYRYWDPMIFLGPKFMGKTLGIIGMGRIGQHFAKMCSMGLGMKIIYVDTNECKAPNLDSAEKVALDYLLENSDVVSIHCNLSPESKHLIGEQELKKMKPDAILINTARGAIINEAALAVALKEKWIEGAGLDVFESEPKIHPTLLELNNVILTPHIGSATREARIQMAKMAATNIVEVLINRKPPINLVNTELTNTIC